MPNPHGSPSKNSYSSGNHSPEHHQSKKRKLNHESFSEISEITKSGDVKHFHISTSSIHPPNGNAGAGANSASTINLSATTAIQNLALGNTPSSANHHSWETNVTAINSNANPNQYSTILSDHEQSPNTKFKNLLSNLANNAMNEVTLPALSTVPHNGHSAVNGHSDLENIDPKTLTSNKHVCEICLSSFKQIKDYKEHMFQIHQQKPFNCKYCYKKFSRIDTVKQHVKEKHPEHWNEFKIQEDITNKKLFCCPVADCDVSYAAKSSILNHLKQNHPEEYTEENVTKISDLCKMMRRQQYKEKKKGKNMKKILNGFKDALEVRIWRFL